MILGVCSLFLFIAGIKFTISNAEHLSFYLKEDIDNRTANYTTKKNSNKPKTGLEYFIYHLKELKNDRESEEPYLPLDFGIKPGDFTPKNNPYEEIIKLGTRCILKGIKTGVYYRIVGEELKEKLLHNIKLPNEEFRTHIMEHVTNLVEEDRITNKQYIEILGAWYEATKADKLIY